LYSGLSSDGSSHGVSKSQPNHFESTRRYSLPTSRVYSTTPIPQISTGSAAYPCPAGPPSYQLAWGHRLIGLLTSGATYGKLPHLPLSNLVLPLCRKTAHNPKSEILRFPLAASNRFSGLRSRCAIPLLCKKDCTDQLSLRIIGRESHHSRA
jgi:hypothetical protein